MRESTVKTENLILIVACSFMITNCATDPRDVTQLSLEDITMLATKFCATMHEKGIKIDADLPLVGKFSIDAKQYADTTTADHGTFSEVTTCKLSFVDRIISMRFLSREFESSILKGGTEEVKIYSRLEQTVPCGDKEKMDIRVVPLGDDWFIEPDSVKHTYSSKGESTFEGISDKSGNGYNVRGQVASTSDCIPSSGDGQGVLTVFTEHLEIRM